MDRVGAQAPGQPGVPGGEAAVKGPVQTPGDRILDTITAMVEELKRGRDVEFPFGKLKRVKRHFSQWWDAVDDSPANRQRYTV